MAVVISSCAVGGSAGAMFLLRSAVVRRVHCYTLCAEHGVEHICTGAGHSASRDSSCMRDICLVGDRGVNHVHRGLKQPPQGASQL